MFVRQQVMVFVLPGGTARGLRLKRKLPLYLEFKIKYQLTIYYLVLVLLL